MITRGRTANHLYLQVVGDDDPNTLIRPETLTPAPRPRCCNTSSPATTPPPQPPPCWEGSATRLPGCLNTSSPATTPPTSATTLLGGLSDPAAWLFDTVRRYTDGLHLAAEQLVGPQIVEMLDGRADQIVPELTNELSWPMLRAHLLGLAAETGQHPLLHLQTAAAGRELHTAKTWPPCWIGASQNPTPAKTDHCPGYPGSPNDYRTGPFGVSIWPSGPD
jgi:hypothetical protein